jgi:hypothetical protein
MDQFIHTNVKHGLWPEREEGEWRCLRTKFWEENLENYKPINQKNAEDADELGICVLCLLTLEW